VTPPHALLAFRFWYAGAVQELKRQAEQLAREENESKAREAEAKRIEAARLAQIRRDDAERQRREAARQAAERRRQQIDAYVASLEAAINKHIDSAVNVNTSDTQAVQQYNDTTDYYIAEYKKWTGKDLTYKYKAAP